VSNHPNRSRRENPAANPSPYQVRALRELVQESRGIGVTDAQKLCAERVFSHLRTWQKWENFERRMHPAAWWCAWDRVIARPNRKGSPAANPTPDQLRAVRIAIQEGRDMGVSNAQKLCADRVFSHLRTWQKWENGERRMHPAVWWCAQNRKCENPPGQIKPDVGVTPQQM